MFTNFRFLTAAFILAGAVVSQADAGWRHRGGSSGGSWGSSGGSWGSSGGSWGSSGGSWGSSGGSWGSSGGSSGGWYHHRHRHHHHHGSSGGWYSSGGSSGGHYYSSHYDDGGDYGDDDYDAPRTRAPRNESKRPAAPGTEPAPPAEAPKAGEPAADGMTSNRDGNALLTVHVPNEARVFVNNLATSSSGSDRTFVSRNLRWGARYNYEVRAEIVRDGKSVTETKSVELAANENAELNFTFAKPEQTAAKATVLKVHVPADAKVYLAGKETRSAGEVREFTTSKLAEGQEWTNYTIRAVVTRNGKLISRDETISLKAGEARQLSFDFGADKAELVAKAGR